MSWKDIFPKRNCYFETENGILYCGDCLEIMKEFPKESIDFVITSPPYLNINKYGDIFVPSTIEEYINWFLPISKEIFRLLHNSGSFILNIGDVVKKKERTLYPFQLVIEMKSSGWKVWDLLIWNKLKGLPIQKRFMNIHEYLFVFVKNLNEFYCNIDDMRVEYSESSLKRMRHKIKRRYARDENNQNSSDYKEWKPNEKGALPKSIINISSEVKRVSDKHFAVFPEKLVSYFVKGFTNKGFIVLDSFVGSGTTAVVCEKLNRRWIGIELSEEYCEIAKRRIEEATRQTKLF